MFDFKVLASVQSATEFSTFVISKAFLPNKPYSAVLVLCFFYHCLN